MDVEEDFDYREQDDSGDLDGHDDMHAAHSTAVHNQPHDEEVALSETGSFGAHDDPSSLPKDSSMMESRDMDDLPPQAMTLRQPLSSTGTASDMMRSDFAPSALERPTASGSSPTDPDLAVTGGYNAADFKHLNVADDIRELFQFIGHYKPQSIELETRLKPFIPDYIAAVGSIDEFIKVPRPDGRPDFLGLKVLDEPASRQSDPTVLTLQLRQYSKDAPGSKAEMVGRIEHADENKSKKIAQWIASIQDIHKSKPAATVSYSRRMPDIEALMQEWPPEMEMMLRGMKSPTGELDLDLKTYSKMLCALLDIPVYENPVESLHVLFTLYLEFKNNPVFRQHMDMENRGLEMEGAGSEELMSSMGRGNMRSAGEGSVQMY
ncbi:MAG: hypothetical protein WDW38_007898 [Sanguina aurantia]